MAKALRGGPSKKKMARGGLETRCESWGERCRHHKVSTERPAPAETSHFQHHHIHLFNMWQSLPLTDRPVQPPETVPDPSSAKPIVYLDGRRPMTLNSNIFKFYTMSAGLTYVVTGGCGFLGSHIVDLLVQRGKNISEIRVRNLEVTASLRSVAQKAQFEYPMPLVCAGADVVIHTVSLNDLFGLINDVTLWDVNVKGTETLLQCCLNEDVTSFVYTSSRLAVGPNRRGDPVEDGDESTPYDSSSPVLFYGRTKAAAESAVLRSNGRRTNGGKTLHTCALRPGGTSEPLRSPMAYMVMVNGVRIRCGGTSAWIRSPGPSNTSSQGQERMFVRRERRLGSPPGRSDAGDVTKHRRRGGVLHNRRHAAPVQNEVTRYSELCAPIGIRWDDSVVLPLWVLYFIAYVLAFLRFLLKPFYNFVPPITPALLTLLNTTFYFNCKKARRLLGYKPLFTWEESKQKMREGLQEWKTRKFSHGRV
ncbi:3 beta-hydroxysteroid dehydrogenase type 7 [Branchiostoma belcheri]|nr:3 beta-hydroxysteroid dehydrogenase type 7 [Branchiostoma belcheri]